MFQYQVINSLDSKWLKIKSFYTVTVTGYGSLGAICHIWTLSASQLNFLKTFEVSNVPACLLSMPSLGTDLQLLMAVWIYKQTQPEHHWWNCTGFHGNLNMIIMLHAEFWMLLTCNCIPDYRYAASIPVFNGYILQYCVSLFETIVQNCFIDETK